MTIKDDLALTRRALDAIAWALIEQRRPTAMQLERLRVLAVELGVDGAINERDQAVKVAHAVLAITGDLMGQGEAK